MPLLGFDFDSRKIEDFSLLLLESFTSAQCWAGGTKTPKQACLALSHSPLLGFNFESRQIGNFLLSLLESFTSERCWAGMTKIPQ